MGRVIACGIPQGAGQKDGGIPARAGQKAAEGDEPAEYRREQDTKKARRKRPSGIPQETGLKAAEYRRERDKGGGIPPRAGHREKTDGRQRAK